MRRKLLMTTMAAGALALAGCGAGGLSGGSAGAGGTSTSGSSPSASSSSAAAAGELAAAKTSLGTVVVDGKGMTVYVFDKDTVGASSACTGTCVGLWPALTTTSSAPTVTGVTGAVGTVSTADGGKQVTLDGHRLYTFSGDSQAGQVNGQGFMNLWWAVSPAGQQIKGAAGAASSPSSSAPGYTY